MIMPDTHIQQILEYYMGKNTMQRQEFIIDNLKVELDLVDDKINIPAQYAAVPKCDNRRSARHSGNI